MRMAMPGGSRAQQVRSRRADESKERLRQVNDTFRKPASARPPVVTRRTGPSMAGTPVHRKTKAPVRKSYYYSLSTPGAEVRLPALPALAFGWRLVSGLLTVAFAVALFALYNAEQFQVEAVRVLGAGRLTQDEISTTLGLERMPVIEITPQDLEKDLLAAYADLQGVKVTVGMPNRVTVTVTERQPVLAWQKGEETLWIDAEGYAFPARGEPIEGLVTVQADGDPAGSAAPVLPASITEAGEAVAPVDQPAHLPYLASALIAPITEMSQQLAGQPVVYNPSYGLGWNDPQGWQVFFGRDFSQLEVKLKAYQAIVAELQSRGITPTMISVENLHAPFYRVE